jgi:hypothetical protein
MTAKTVQQRLSGPASSQIGVIRLGEATIVSSFFVTPPKLQPMRNPLRVRGASPMIAQGAIAAKTPRALKASDTFCKFRAQEPVSEAS